MWTVRSHTHTNTHTQKKHTHAHIETYTYTHTHTHTHIYIYTHTHANWLLWQRPALNIIALRANSVVGRRRFATIQKRRPFLTDYTLGFIFTLSIP